MKIAYIIANFPTRSETFVVREVYGMIERGFDVTVYTFGGDAIPVEDMSPALRAVVPHIRRLPRRRALRAFLRARLDRDAVAAVRLNRALHAAATVHSNAALRLGRAYALAHVLSHDGTDHIHAHWPYASQVAALVHALTGIPYSASIHAHEVAHENGHFPLLFESLAFATFCNRAAMCYLLDRLPPDCRTRSHLVYHGVETDDFPYSPPPPRTQPLRVVSAGRFTPTKGFDRLIAACARAREQGLDVTLTLLGGGALAAHLIRRADELDFREHLTLTGWIPHNRVPGYLHGSHVFALLAEDTYHDGLPNVVLEAMACGRPVIVSPLPAVAEAVTHGHEGFVLESPVDIEGCAEYLARLAADRPLLVEMGRAASHRIQREHTATRQLDRLAAIFAGEQSKAVSHDEA